MSTPFRKFWSKKRELRSRDETYSVQSILLQNIVKYVFDNSNFYKKKFSDRGIFPEDIKTLDDLKKLPFTTKEELRENQEKYPPFGNYLCVPLKRCVKLHASSGSTGEPTKILFTRYDLRNWAEYFAQAMWTIGVRPTDVFQNSVNSTLFVGQGNEHAVMSLGALFIMMGTGRSEFQIKFMKDVGTTVMNSTPTYAIHLTKIANEMGLNPREELKGLRLWMVAGEPGGSVPATRRIIEDFWAVKVMEMYGLSDMATPTAVMCKEQNGLHTIPDYQIVEIINSKTGEVLDEGIEGEVVVTNLKREGMPLIRLRTGDISSIDFSVCPCKRTSIKIKRITGRIDDMLIIKGVNVWPSAIENIVRDIKGTTGEFQIIVNKNTLTELLVKVAYKRGIRNDEKERLLRDIEKRLEQELFVKIKVELASEDELPLSEMKAHRIVDLRSN